MPTARVGLRLLEHEGKIWAIGGYHATNGAQSIVEIYDPSSDSWVSGLKHREELSRCLETTRKLVRGWWTSKR